MTRPDDPRLKGLPPEFARMSLRPGIGAGFMHDYASTMLEHGLDETMVDVPSAVRVGSKMMPIGRHLQQRLRKLIGRDVKAPQAVLDGIAEELFPMRKAAFDASRSFKKVLVEEGEQARKNLESKTRFRIQRRSL